MKLPSLLASLLLLPALVPHAGAQQSGGVAVLDIDRVAKTLRIDQSVLTELKQVESSLNSQLSQVRTNLQQQMNQIEAKFGAEKTPEAQAQIVEANRKLNADFNAVRNEAQTRMTAARLQKINEFRDQLRPIAQAAAKARGLQVVLTVVPEVYAYAPEVDITDDVIKAAKEAGLEQPEAPAPDPQAAPATAPAPAAPAAEKGKAGQ